MADDGRVADAFLAIDEALTSRGFSHYEISNYAMPGEEARHNLGYWRGEDYVAVGCGAYGSVDSSAGKIRYRNEVDPRAYIAGAEATDPERGVGDGGTVELLDAETRMKERIMLGLRLASGFNLREAAAELGADPWPRDRARAAEMLVSRGRLQIVDNVLSIPKAGWLYTDDTAARLF